MNSNQKNIDEYEQRSLYSFQNEHDACGVGLILNLYGEKSHEIVEKGLQVLENMVHRGAESADNKTGDGAGIWCKYHTSLYYYKAYRFQLKENMVPD